MRSHAFLLLALFAIACADDEGDQASKTGSRLQILTYEMADGSRLVRGFWDGQTQEDCVVGYHADGKLRCLPSLAYKLGPYFQGDTCFGTLAAVVPKELVPHSQFGIETDGFRSKVFRVGNPTPIVYQGTPEACAKVDVGDKQTAYTMQSEVLGENFVEAFEQRN